MKFPEDYTLFLSQTIVDHPRPTPYFMLKLSEKKEGGVALQTAVWSHPFLLRIRLRLGLRRLHVAHRKLAKFHERLKKWAK